MCARCQKDNIVCVFDVSDGMTKMQGLQQQLDQRNVDHDRLMILMNAFQHGSDDLATFLLARLRIGESVEQLVCSIEAQEGVASQPPHSQPQRRGTYPSLHHELWPDLNPEDEEPNSKKSIPLDGSPPPKFLD